jgi:hypothetical protein
VIEEENRLMTMPPERWDRAPHLDDAMLKILNLNAQPPAVFGFKDLVKHVQTPAFDRMRRRFEDRMRDSEQLLALKREQLLTDADYARRLKRPTSGPRIETPTRYVVRETVNDLIQDKKKAMPAKEWIDLGHMEVVVSYADFVLLDKAWADRARRVRERLEKAGLKTRFASVHSAATLPDFWTAFDV